MAKEFEQFHLSLIERAQVHLYEPQRSREEWLRHIFGAQFEFAHMGNTFYWVPQTLSEEFIVGVIERQKSQVERTPPSKRRPGN